MTRVLLGRDFGTRFAQASGFPKMAKRFTSKHHRLSRGVNTESAKFAQEGACQPFRLDFMQLIVAATIEPVSDPSPEGEAEKREDAGHDDPPEAPIFQKRNRFGHARQFDSRNRGAQAEPAP